MGIEVLDNFSVVLQLSSATKEEAVRELIRRAPVFREVADAPELAAAVMKREKIMSTGLGRGVAIAHGECSAIPHVAVALGISEKGIAFDALDGKPVHLLFVVVNPEPIRNKYLEVLSTLTKLLRFDDVRGELRCCTCISEVEGTLRRAFQELRKSA